MRTIEYDTQEFPFSELVLRAVQPLASEKRPGVPFTDLSELHKWFSEVELPPVFEAIYALFMTPEFERCYDGLCSDIIAKELDGAAAFQRVPSARIQMPGMRSVNFHTDEWYGHGPEIVNFWLPLVPVSGKNSMYVADDDISRRMVDDIARRKVPIPDMNRICVEGCQPLDMVPGQVFMFTAKTMHGTVINDVPKSRVSFDFRMVRDGDSPGFKDKSFFVKPGILRQSKEPTEQRTGAVYIHQKTSQPLSQKYQLLVTYRYAAEKKIAVTLGETELAGFDYQPALWNLIEGGFKGKFTDLILFSADALPAEKPDLLRLKSALDEQDIDLHIVSEDRTIRAGDALP